MWRDHRDGDATDFDGLGKISEVQSDLEVGAAEVGLDEGSI